MDYNLIVETVIENFLEIIMPNIEKNIKKLPLKEKILLLKKI